MAGVRQLECDVAVVGAGPAGVAAAVAAAGAGKKVALLDDNPRPGGQIWRGGPSAKTPTEAQRWFQRLEESPVQVLLSALVFRADAGFLEAEIDNALVQIRCDKVILATGAREMFLPFPGWTLPNVFGAGGLQALVKSGLPVEGKRVVLAGTGPLLLAVAAYLSAHKAEVLCICEQASFQQVVRFGLATLQTPKKFAEAAALRFESRRARYLNNAWPLAALGSRKLESVRISQNGQIREIACDYLGCGYHLTPNTELAQLLGCRLREGFVQVDDFQETSRIGIFCAGEPTGIGGMELAVVEGQIAGHAAAGRQNEAARFMPARQSYRRVSTAMKTAFGLRPELAKLAEADTLLCRCEDVPLEQLRQHDSWKAAKLHTRCGMGPCQGRVCGAAAAFLFGWNVAATRPPVYPVRCASLASGSSIVEAAVSHGGSQ
jgi:NADPH-dependent 2,4-dienoyl-CoA reductase/sulfur reductase-like enzyme